MGVDEVLLKIRALVEGQSQVKGLTGDVNALDSATSKLDTTYRDVNGRLRDAQGRFVAVGQAAREAGSGFSFAGGHLGKFSMNLTGLNAGLEIVQRVTQTVQGLMQGVGDLAHQYEAGQAAARQWEVVLERYGINAKTADAAMLELSNRTGVNIEALKGMAAQYVKMGGTLEDFQKGALAATSSWNDLSVKSISLEDSISNVTTGLAQGRSELMESSGIVVNASQAWEKWAEANDRTVKSMTDAEKAHAYAIAVYREEEIGISTLAERQTDLVKAETQAANAKKELGKAVGEIVLPLYTRYVQVGAEVTTQTLEIARAFVQGGDAVQALSQKYPQLAGTLQVIQRVFTDVRDTARDVFERTVQPALERLAPKVQQMGSVVAPTFVKLGQVLKEVAGTAREAFERVIVPLFEAVAPVVMRVVQRVLPLLAQLAGAFSEYFKMVVAAWENIALPVIQTIAPIVQRVVDVVANVLGGVIATVKNVFQAVRAMIEGDWSKAWEHLKTAVGTALLSVQTLLQGAGKIIADVLPKVWEKAKELGTSIKDGILTGIANLQDELAQAVGRALQNMLGYIPEWAQRLLNITADGQSTMGYTGKSGTLGSLQSMLADLGLGSVPKSQGYGANRNLHGYGPGGHPGVDYAAPVGTKLYAPIAGTASYGYDHLSGRFIKLVDAEGNAIKLSHLSKVGEQLDAMMKAAGGAVQVAKGQLLGYSGGAKSDPMRGNSTGPHVDIMIYSKDGTIQNPERFRIGQGSRSPVPVPVTAPDAPPKVPKPTTPAPPANTTDPIKPEKAEDIRKRIEAQIKDILARVDLKLISKDAAIKLLQGIDDQATAVAKKQGKGWQEYAATAKSAESAIQSLTKTKKGAKDTVDVLAALSAQFEYAGKSGLPAYVKGLEAYIAQQERARKAAKDGSKEELEATQNVNRARQLLKDAQAGKGTAFVTEADLKKYRAGAEEVIRLEKAMATSTDVDWKRRAQNRITAYGEQGQAAQNVLNLLKSQDQTETQLSEKAKAREKERKALIAQAAQEARELRYQESDATLNRIRSNNKAELDAFKGTAAEKLALIRKQSQAEFDAAEVVARIKRNNALRDNDNNTAQTKANHDENARQIKQQYTDYVEALKNTRVAAIRAAGEDFSKTTLDSITGVLDASAAENEKLINQTQDTAVKLGETLAEFTQGVADENQAAIDETLRALAELEDAINRVRIEAFDLGLNPDGMDTIGTQDLFSREFTKENAKPVKVDAVELLHLDPASVVQMGNDMGQDFIDGVLGSVSKESLAWLGPEALQGLIDAVGDDPKWAAFKSNLEAALGTARDLAAEISTLVSSRGAEVGYNLPIGENTPDRSDPLGLSPSELRDTQKSFDDLIASIGEMDAAQLSAIESSELLMKNEQVAAAVTARHAQVQKDAAAAIIAVGEAAAQANEEGITDLVKGQQLLADAQRKVKEAAGEFIGPNAAMIAGLEALRGKAEVNQEELERLIGKLRELDAAAANQKGIDQLTNQLDQLAGNFQKAGQIAKMFTDGGENAVSILGDWVTMNTTAYKQFMSGDVGGAILTTIEGILNVGESIASLNPKLREYKKNMLEIAQLEKDAMGSKKYGSISNPYYDTLGQDAANRDKLGNSKWYQRLWWDITGSTPQVLDDATAKLQAKAATIFGDMADGINEVWNTAWQTAFEQGTPIDLTKNLTKMFNMEVAKQAMAAILEKADIGGLLKAYTDARAAGKSGEEELAKLRAALTQAGQDADAILKTLPGYGSEADPAARERELATTRNNNYQAGLKLQLSTGLITKQQYDALFLKSEHDRLNLEMEAALANTELTEEQRAEIKEGFRIQNAQLDADYAKEQAEQERQRVAARADMTMNAEQQALELKHKKGLISEEEYQKGLLDLTIKRLEKERAAEKAKAGGDPALLKAIDDYYDAAIENAKWDSANAGKSAGNAFADGFEDALQKRESMLSSWRDSLKNGVAALLSGDSPLQAMYDSVRQRIGQALQEGLTVKRIIGRLDPLFEQLDGALNTGLNPASIIAQIGAKLPSLAIEMQTSLGPIIAALNQALGYNTAAVRENTKAIENQASHVTNFNLAPVSDVMRRKLGRFA